jgi:integrase
MPKSRRPSLLFHKPSGQARVRIDGKDHYLGAFGSPEAQARYDLLIDEWLRRKSLDRATITVDELALRFLEHAIGYYVKDGVQTSEDSCIRLALRPVVRLFGNLLACQFGPLKLKQARQAMIDAGAKRSTINRHVGRIKLAFRWAVENELLPVEVFSALTTVRGLAQGRTEAVEADPVKPVALAFVEAIRPHVSRQVWAMVELQLLTSARPGEIVSLSVGEINTTGRIWEYIPRSHKTEHHGKLRLIPLGPKAQAVLREFLRTDLRAYVFSPIEADQERAAQRRQERQTPLTPSQMVGFYDIAVPISQSDIKARKFPSFLPTPDQIAHRLIQQFDADCDGKISQREIPLRPVARKLFFVALDQNHDGIITFEEISRGIEKFGIVDRRSDAQRVSKK